MALVVEDDHVDLLQMSAFGNRPVGTLRSIPYAEIAGVDTRDWLLEVRVAIRTNAATRSSWRAASSASARRRR